MRLALVLLLLLLSASGPAGAVSHHRPVQTACHAAERAAVQRHTPRDCVQPARAAAASIWMVLLVGLLAAPARPARRRAARRRSHALTLAAGEVRAQRQRLRMRRLQLLVHDPYGSADLRSWTREKARFCSSRIMPLLVARRLADQWPGIAEAVDRGIERAAARAPRPRRGGFDPAMPPIEYERLCALLLRRAGWDARVTAAGGDQGTDVLARRGRRSLVLQCKLYGRPVGNRAVQQVAAARAHHRADYAAVVSNAAFTRHARELAATNGVHLLHHDELSGFRAPASRPPELCRPRR